jgi:hypothetical protein
MSAAGFGQCNILYTSFDRLVQYAREYRCNFQNSLHKLSCTGPIVSIQPGRFRYTSSVWFHLAVFPAGAPAVLTAKYAGRILRSAFGYVRLTVFQTG